jgi:hypothetical protein
MKRPVGAPAGGPSAASAAAGTSASAAGGGAAAELPDAAAGAHAVAMADALLSLVQALASSTSGCTALADAGVVSSLMPLLRDTHPDHVGLVVNAVRILEALVDFSQSALTLFRCGAAGGGEGAALWERRPQATRPEPGPAGFTAARGPRPAIRPVGLAPVLDCRPPAASAPSPAVDRDLGGLSELIVRLGVEVGAEAPPPAGGEAGEATPAGDTQMAAATPPPAPAGEGGAAPSEAAGAGQAVKQVGRGCRSGRGLAAAAAPLPFQSPVGCRDSRCWFGLLTALGPSLFVLRPFARTVVPSSCMPPRRRLKPPTHPFYPG